MYRFIDSTDPQTTGDIISGQVEMCYEGKGYFPICEELIHERDSVCNELGYRGICT